MSTLMELRGEICPEELSVGLAAKPKTPLHHLLCDRHGTVSTESHGPEETGLMDNAEGAGFLKC